MRRSDFPSTHWSVFCKVADDLEDSKAFNALISRYWRPVYAFIYAKGYQQEADDLTQEFFSCSLRRKLWQKADQRKGRFRDFLLRAVENFLASEYRKAKRAEARFPLLSMDQLREDIAIPALRLRPH
jgi:DNA-directed RNA polymerase specialized sigma24 family protein